MDNLLPCPFCGSTDIQVNDGHAVNDCSCRACFAVGPDWIMDKGDAAARWNARHQPSAPAWIAVETKLPEVDEQVWVALRFPDGSTDQGYAIWTGVDWFLDVNESGSLIARQAAIQQGLDAADVTHWMPLPSPPTEQ